jgi:iron complex transport system permease protein
MHHAHTRAPRELRRGSPRAAVLTTTLIVLLAASALLAIGLGSAVVPPADTVRYLWAALTGETITTDDVTRYQIVWQIRTPRVLLAVLVGAGLGTVGVAVQSLVRNALADPFVLGISSGGAVGAVAVSTVGALAGFGIYATSIGAFAGAMAATVLVFAIAYARSGTTPLRLVLTGVALSFGFQAVMSVLIYLVPGNEATSTLLFWSMGSFGAATWGVLPAVAAVVLAGSIALHRFARTLDVMSLGDEAAVSMGVDPARHRHALFAVTAVMTGAMVAASGAIGFAGLVVPHVTRMLVGARHAQVLVVAPLLGAVLMVWVDLLARTLVAPRELPIGVLTALIGVPVFLVLMRRRQYVFGGTS